MYATQQQTPHHSFVPVCLCSAALFAICAAPFISCNAQAPPCCWRPSMGCAPNVSLNEWNGRVQQELLAMGCMFVRVRSVTHIDGLY
jgi:hypothetical protein